MATAFRLTVIRHLPTMGNQRKEYIGWTDESILAVEQDAYHLPWQPEIVYGSDLRRCQQSAAVYFPNANYVAHKGLRESHFGAWEGKTYAQLKEEEAYRQWIDDPFTHRPPAGESIDQVETRLLQALYGLPSGQDHQIIVTHGGPIRLLLTMFSPQPTDFWAWTIPHGTAWQLVWTDERAFREGKRCTSILAVPLMAKQPTCKNN